MALSSLRVTVFVGLQKFRGLFLLVIPAQAGWLTAAWLVIQFCL
jgi:hypothetical protein